MKSRTVFFSILLIAAMFSCNMKKGNTDVIAPGTDSTMMAKDSSTIKTSTTLVGDTSSAAVATATKVASTDKKAASVKADSSANSNSTKKYKKGKVSIAEATKATGNMTADKEGFYTNTEVLPAFPGGQKALERFFEDNIQYPDNATENNAEGTVNLNFAVDESGKVYAPKIVSKNIGYGIEPEALRVFNKMPKWTPGQIKGKNVKSKYTLPIKFKLD